jgi:hypothetical protein
MFTLETDLYEKVNGISARDSPERKHHFIITTLTTLTTFSCGLGASLNLMKSPGT